MHLLKLSLRNVYVGTQSLLWKRTAGGVEYATRGTKIDVVVCDCPASTSDSLMLGCFVIRTRSAVQQYCREERPVAAAAVALATSYIRRAVAAVASAATSLLVLAVAHRTHVQLLRYCVTLLHRSSTIPHVRLAVYSSLSCSHG